MKAPEVIIRLVTTEKGEFILTELDFPYAHTIYYVSDDKTFKKPITVIGSVNCFYRKPFGFIYKDDNGQICDFDGGCVKNIIEL